MKTLIVGLGNIGTIYGWALSQAGVDVTHVVREGQAKLHSHFRSNPEEMRRFYLDVLKTGEQLEVYTPHLDAMRSRIE